jgi:hypothetical protein
LIAGSPSATTPGPSNDRHGFSAARRVSTAMIGMRKINGVAG